MNDIINNPHIWMILGTLAFFLVLIVYTVKSKNSKEVLEDPVFTPLNKNSSCGCTAGTDIKTEITVRPSDVIRTDKQMDAMAKTIDHPEPAPKKKKSPSKNRKSSSKKKSNGR